MRNDAELKVHPFMVAGLRNINQLKSEENWRAQSSTRKRALFAKPNHIGPATHRCTRPRMGFLEILEATRQEPLSSWIVINIFLHFEWWDEVALIKLSLFPANSLFIPWKCSGQPSNLCTANVSWTRRSFKKDIELLHHGSITKERKLQLLLGLGPINIPRITSLCYHS